MKKKFEIADVRSCWNRASAETNVFVGLDWDPAVPAMIRHWAFERVKLGLNRSDDQQLAEARALADEIEANLPLVRAAREATRKVERLDPESSWPFAEKPA